MHPGEPVTSGELAPLTDALSNFTGEALDLTPLLNPYIEYTLSLGATNIFNAAGGITFNARYTL